jgi:hypothetical protein
MEPPQDVTEASAPIAVSAPQRSRRWSQLGVIGVVLVAIVVGLLSVGRSLLPRDAVPGLVSDNGRPPLEVIQPGARGDDSARDARPARSVPNAIPREEAPVADPQAAAPAAAPAPAVRMPENDSQPVAPAPPALEEHSAAQCTRCRGDPPRNGTVTKGIHAFDAAPPVDDARVAAIQPPPAAKPGSGRAAGRHPAVVASRPSRRRRRRETALASPLPASDRGIALALQRYQTVTVGQGNRFRNWQCGKYGQASHTILDMVACQSSLRNVDVVTSGQNMRLPELDEDLVLLRQGHDQYALLLLSTPAWQRVKNLEVVLRQKGLQAQVQETDFGPGHTVYRLLIGGLASRESALATGKRVQRLFREDDQVAALAR